MPTIPNCLLELQNEIKRCTEEYDDGYSKCTKKRDEGYNSCSGWGIFSFVCIAWTWVSNWVCVAWEWIENIICVAWAVVKVPVCVLYNFVDTWIIDSRLGRNVTSVPRERATAFNISQVPNQHSYTDSGTYYEVRINDGQVEYKERNGNWTLLLLDPEGYNGNLSGPVAVSYSKIRGRGNMPKNEDNFDMYRPPRFDMIAASENRIFVKEEKKDNFYIVSIVRDFCCFKKLPSQEPKNVPGYYAKLDPQCFAPGANDDDFLLIKKDEYNRHVSLDGFLLYNISRKLNQRSLLRALKNIFNAYRLPLLYPLIVGLVRLLKPDLMLVQFDAGIWNLLDTRPPKNSGKPPNWVRTYKHVTYGWEIESLNFRLPWRSEMSIEFHKVLGIGVGRLHRHTHYDSSHGGELHVLAFNTGPVGDFASFYDGTCNYFILCQLKPSDTITDDNLEDAFGLLWIDEQTYYSERWRLVHPLDEEWDPSRGIASYGGPNLFGSGWWKAYEDKLRFREDYILKKELFWCPFRAGYIDKDSRLAVARQTIIVSSKKMDANVPDHVVLGEYLLFSIVFSWGSIDRTWRWRRFPQNAEAKILSENEERAILKDETLSVELGDGDTFYPQLIGLRDDMTIYVRGTKIIGGVPWDGYWYQKYLPADNWECPFIGENAEGEEKEKQSKILKMPKNCFEHEWQFMLKENFNRANTFSHFGVYDIVNSRSQYYEISVEDDSMITEAELAECDEDTKWVDFENSLYILQPQIDYPAIEDQIDPPLDPFEALQATSQPTVKLWHRPPSFFNNKTYIKIVNRPKKNEWNVPRFIAILWDKRDDDLLEFTNMDQAITLMYDPARKNDVLAGKLLKIKLKKRQILWKPPVVQKASISLDTVNQVVTVYFHSEIGRRPRYFQHWKRIEAYRGLGIDVLQNIMGPAYSMIEPHIDNVDPYYNEITDPDPYPCPDITIYKVKMNVMIGQEYKVFEKTINAFEGEFAKNQFVFTCHWNAGEEGNFSEMTKYLIEPGNFEHATNLVFEDIVGHVTIPQITEFLIGGCTLDPLVTWDDNQQKLVGDVTRGNKIKIINRSRKDKMLDVRGGVVEANIDEGSCYILVSESDVSIQCNNSSDVKEISIIINNVADNGLQPVAAISYRIAEE